MFGVHLPFHPVPHFQGFPFERRDRTGRNRFAGALRDPHFLDIVHQLVYPFRRFPIFR